MPAPGGGFAQPGGARCPRGGPRARARVRCGATGFLSAGARGVAGPSARGSGCGGGCGGAPASPDGVPSGGAPPPVRRGASRAAGAGTLGAGLRAGHPGAGAGHPGERAGCGTGPSPPAAVRPGPGSVAGTVPWGLAAPPGGVAPRGGVALRGGAGAGAGPGGGRRAGGGAGPLAYRSWSLICRWHRPCSCHRLLPWCLRPAVVPASCRGACVLPCVGGGVARRWGSRRGRPRCRSVRAIASFLHARPPACRAPPAPGSALAGRRLPRAGHGCPGRRPPGRSCAPPPCPAVVPGTGCRPGAEAPVLRREPEPASVPPGAAAGRPGRRENPCDGPPPTSRPHPGARWAVPSSGPPRAAPPPAAGP